jgi:hypothetical protein
VNAHEVIDSFVVEMLPRAPLARQVEVAKAMASHAATPEERKQWDAIAASLQQADHDIRQLYSAQFQS